MAEATDMIDATPLPSTGNFRMQMERLASAGLYVLFFGWIHLGAGFDVAMTLLLTYFFLGLIIVPLIGALPLVLMRGALGRMMKDHPNAAAFLPFARFALCALQGIALWVVTREAYLWAFANPVAA